MPRSSRWLIAAGYLTPAGVLGLAWLSVPAGAGDLGGAAWFALALLVAAVLAGLLFLAGAATAIEALVRARGRFRWYDYALLTAGVAPLLALAIGVLRPA